MHAGVRITSPPYRHRRPRGGDPSLRFSSVVGLRVTAPWVAATRAAMTGEGDGGDCDGRLRRKIVPIGNISLDICEFVPYMFRMNHPAPNLPEEDDDDAPAWARRHLGMLVDLGDMGMVLARNLVRRAAAETEAAEAQAEDAPSPGRGPAIDPALSFTRISRAVRLTIALEARMRREIEAGVFGVANDDAPAQQDFMTPDGQVDYAAIRRRLHPLIHGETDYETRRAVEETIEVSTDDPVEVERLKGELKERLEEEDPEDIFFNRTHWPIGEAIALICQDLGLEPDWDCWENRAWARQEAETSPPGSPYATVEQPDRVHYTGTERYREARGLPPLEGSLTFRAARGPP